MSGKRRPKSIFVRADQGIGALQVDVVAQHDQAALLEIAIDSARGIRDQNRADSHARHHAHRKNHLLWRVAFIEMHAALHHRYRHVRHFPITMRPAWPMAVDRGKIRDLFIVNARGIREFVGERAQSAAEDEADARAQLCFRENEFRGAFGAQEFLARFRFLAAADALIFRNIPTIDADIKFAMVPASIARMPNLASCAF